MNTPIICFDVDGTLIDDDGGKKNIWEFIHRRFGISHEENNHRFERFMRKEITYSEWVDLDVGDWKTAGLTFDMLISVVDELSLMPGTKNTIFELKKRGYQLAVISGSINIGLEHLFPEHPFDPVYLNRLFFAENGQISHWKATAFDLDQKSIALKEIAVQNKVSFKECAFVGDNFNDVDAAKTAGFSIAFNSKSEELDATADAVIPEKNLEHILPYFPAIR